MKLARNVGLGLANSIWTALLGLAVVPLYLKFLGIEAYGLIGFFATTQALFQILDLGMAPTINREIARSSASGRWRDMRKLLHTLAVIYWCVAGMICLTMIVAAPAISAHWLKSSTLDHGTIVRALRLMGLVIACRWPTGLYIGALNGLQRIDVSSWISIAMSTIGNLGAVCVLAFVSPTVGAFFLWQAGAGVIYAMVLRWAAWRALGPASGAEFDFQALKSIWRFSATMMALTFAGLALSQFDKVLLSNLLTLDAFGQYVLAGVVASALGIVITPFYNAIYPRFSASIASHQNSEVLKLYRLSGRLLAAVLFPVAMVVAVEGEDLIRLWTGNPHLAENVAPLAALLAVGTALHGTMYIPYALQLAEGKTFIPLTISFALLAIMGPLTISLALHYGALGGAMAWVILHVLYIALGTSLMHRYIGKWAGFPWLAREIGIPFLICGSIGLFAMYAINSTAFSTYMRLAVVFTSALVSVLVTFAVSPELRSAVFSAVAAELRR
ncbi:MAG TPA: oligosaccharide flippase family protein [Steroidobacteraceae bacterium]|nr:oligosaccharide flippase family protein [Steroidobacteraceae bacterium]